MHVSALCVYPLKSAAGIPLTVMHLDERGPRFDRRWMLIDDDGRFISQREQARLSIVTTSICDDRLVVASRQRERFVVPDVAPDAPRIRATIWDDVVDVVHVGADADSWFSNALETSCRLVCFPDDSIRIADRTFNPEGRPVGLADGFPLLLIGEASNDELNDRIVGRGGAALPMNRYRPNIVVAGAAPWAEDGWQTIQIGGETGVQLSLVKPCARCAIPTIDQETGRKGKEPLATLATYRRGPDGSVFVGQNAIHDGPGILRVGDGVVVSKAAS